MGAMCCSGGTVTSHHDYGWVERIEQAECRKKLNGNTWCIKITSKNTAETRMVVGNIAPQINWEKTK